MVRTLFALVVFIIYWANFMVTIVWKNHLVYNKKYRKPILYLTFLLLR